MSKEDASLKMSDEDLTQYIYLIRGQKVMLDRDLASLYGVETKQLKRQVNRNLERFPSDFMFELNEIETQNLRSHFGTSSWGGNRYLVMAFTEQGVAMLSSVLNSKKAIAVNIEIIRVFTKIRQMLLDNTELRLEVEKIKRKTENNSKNIEVVFRYMDEFIEKKENPKPQKSIGFKTKP
ncbi:MAG: DNA-binding protein [Bacteroidetes bacterium]|jgi:hypothetical protein|nr:DNA-binding protein [Bacteroidota bacterium]